jgi:exopolyphosphatase/guanosine-5'-triphosphate,3'-diphosphate pyrophosphatase
VRLGQGTFAAGRIAEKMIDATLTTMREIAEKARESGAAGVRAVATSAMREAANAAEIVARIREETGIDVEVITAEREGELIARGALLDLSGSPQRNTAVLDIGGGSAEVVVVAANDTGAVTSMEPLSFRLGAVRLTVAHLSSTPPAAGEIERLRTFIASQLPAKPFEPEQAVGCGGTLVSAERIAKAMGLSLEPSDADGLPRLSMTALQNMIDALQSLTVEEILARFPIERPRAEVILAGALALEGLLAWLELDEIAVTPAGLREGLLAEHLGRLTTDTRGFDQS